VTVIVTVHQAVLGWMGEKRDGLSAKVGETEVRWLLAKLRLRVILKRIWKKWDVVWYGCILLKAVNCRAP